MSQKRNALGRNLSALLGQSSSGLQQSAADTVLLHCPIASLVAGPYQPRRTFDEASLAELAASIQQQGLLQPIVVRALNPGQYEIIAGERRWRASQLAGLSTVPALLRQVDDQTALAFALIENLQRTDLCVIDEAHAIARLSTEFSLTHQQIANLLARSRASISNHLRLLHLDPAVQVMLQQGELDMGHARCLLTLPAAEQIRIAKKIVSDALSVRATEALLARRKTAHQPLKNVAYHPRLEPQLEALSSCLQTNIRIKSTDGERGSLLINYQNLSQLEQIIAQILE